MAQALAGFARSNAELIILLAYTDWFTFCLSSVKPLYADSTNKSSTHQYLYGDFVNSLFEGKVRFENVQYIL